MRSSFDYPKTFFLLMTLALAGTIGCSGSEDLMQFATEGIPSLSDISLEPEAPAQTPTKKNRKFQPTNPDRINPFSYGEAISTHAELTVESLASVAVMGFANAGKPMVVLSIQGKASTFGVGDKAFGIEIVDITPPTVTMKSAQSEWTASLFESRTRSHSVVAP